MHPPSLLSVRVHAEEVCEYMVRPWWLCVGTCMGCIPCRDYAGLPGMLLVAILATCIHVPIAAYPYGEHPHVVPTHRPSMYLIIPSSDLLVVLSISLSARFNEMITSLTPLRW